MPKPTRRSAMQTIAALAAGLFAAPAFVKAAARTPDGLTARQKAEAAREAELDAYRPHFTPDALRDHIHEYGLMLAAVNEVRLALSEAADLHAEDCGCQLCCEIAGLEYHFCFYEASLSGETLCEANEKAAELAGAAGRAGRPGLAGRAGPGARRGGDARGPEPARGPQRRLGRSPAPRLLGHSVRRRRLVGPVALHRG